jgi:hypothetical protein
VSGGGFFLCFLSDLFHLLLEFTHGGGIPVYKVQFANRRGLRGERLRHGVHRFLFYGLVA